MIICSFPTPDPVKCYNALKWWDPFPIRYRPVMCPRKPKKKTPQKKHLLNLKKKSAERLKASKLRRRLPMQRNQCTVDP